MNVPLQIYDFFAILFPAIIFVEMIKYEFHSLTATTDANTYGGIALAFVLLYLLGQIISVCANWLEKAKYTSWIFRGKRKTIKENQIVLNGRKQPIYLSENVGGAILQGLSDFYGFKVDANEKNLFELVYSPIYDRMDKRDMFLSISNMMRNLSVICLASGVYYVFKLLLHRNFNIETVLPFVLLIVTFFAFKKIYSINKHYAEIIPYTAFLSWYNEKMKSTRN